MLIDTHAHLYWDSFKEDFDEVIQRSLDAGVTAIINVGVDIELSKKAAEQVKNKLSKFPNLKSYSTIGIHPHEAINYSNAVSIHQGMEELEQIYLSDTTKVVAVGECGLDYAQNKDYKGHNDYKFYNAQKKLFQAQIDLAKKLGLPLVVHCREAWDEVLNMIGDHPTILHCYSGLSPTTNYVLQTTNLLVSFAATITYPKNEYLREAVKILPLEKICLETDCPFLPPQSKRGQRNEPATVLEIAQLVAELKRVTLDEVAQQTTKNVKIMLNIE